MEHIFSTQDIKEFFYTRVNYEKRADYENRTERPGCSILHKHSFWEFGIVYSGLFKNHCGQKTLTCSRGTAFLMRPDDIHYFSFDTPIVLWYDVYVKSDHMKAICDLLAPNLFESLAAAESFLHFTIEPDRLSTLENELNFFHVQFMKKSDEMSLRHTSIAFNLVSYYLQSAFKKNSYPDQLKDFLDLIQKPEHMHRSLVEIIKLFPYSHSYLNKLFMTHLNKTPNRCFIENKINFASQLLLNSQKSITDIAFAIGYEHEKNFIKFFKQIYGITPHQWRLKNASNNLLSPVK